MTKKELEEFDTLYQYVRKEILDYDDNQSLPTSFVLRLKGLSEGKFIANKKTKSKANYSFEVILNTFIYCKRSIKRAIKNKTFINEQAKFNYIMAVVQNNINDIYNKMNEADKQKKKVDTHKIEIFENNYERKTEDIKNDRLKNLW